MRPEIKSLVELQVLDTRLAELRNKLAALPQQLANVEKQVTDAKQQLADAREALKASAKDRKTFEMDVDAWKEKARKYRDQSLNVKTNDAYKALQHEIQYAESEVAQAEDRLLERMVAGEEFDRQIRAAEQAIVGVERTAAAERQRIQAEQAALQQELAAKQSERQRHVGDIPEKLFAIYERVAGRRQHIGVAAVRDEACTQCGVRIRPHVFQELRRADCTDIFQCETCTRILYYAEPPAAEAAASAHADSQPPDSASADSVSADSNPSQHSEADPGTGPAGFSGAPDTITDVSANEP